MNALQTCDGEIMTIVLREDNLYQMNFIKVHGADVVNLTQSWKREGAFEFWCR